MDFERTIKAIKREHIICKFLSLPRRRWKLFDMGKNVYFDKI